MRVLLVTESYPPSAGGSGWSAHQLAKALVGRGHSVLVAYLGRRHATYNLEGIPVWELKRIEGVPPGARLVAQEILEAVRLGRTVATLREDFGADVVHAQHRISTLALGYLGDRSGMLVATVRDYWPLCDTGQLYADGRPCDGCTGVRIGRCIGQRYPVLRYALPILPVMASARRRRQEALRRMDAVIAVSRFVAAKLGALLPTARLSVVHNIVDVAEVGPAIERLPHALFVGKLEPNKGAHLLAQIARSLPRGMDLIVAGDGRLLQTLARQGMDNLRLLGWTPKEHVTELMRRCSVLVLPSLWPEPLSRTLLEASAAGLPSVAFPVGGNPEAIVDDLSGYLVGSADEMAERAARIAVDHGLRRRLSEGAVQLARSRFSDEAVLPNLLRVYGHTSEASA